ncbi:hypothetical protein BDW72DRAFT_174771 [Aspergillus terricola var. indicus]
MVRFSRGSGSRRRVEPARTPLNRGTSQNLAARSSSLSLNFRLRFPKWARYLNCCCVLISRVVRGSASPNCCTLESKAFSFGPVQSALSAHCGTANEAAAFIKNWFIQ